MHGTGIKITTDCVVRNVWVEIEETAEHQTSHTQKTECALCKVWAETEEIAEQRSYHTKYGNQTAAFRWVFLILTEDHVVGCGSKIVSFRLMGHIVSFIHNTSS